MFTGKLDNISRAEAKSIVENNGGKIVSNVSKKLDYLITGEKPTLRKVKMANDLKVKLLKYEMRSLNRDQQEIFRASR